MFKPFTFAIILSCSSLLFGQSMTELTTELFANTTYSFTSDFDLENCEVWSRCDCCTFITYFKDSVNFYNIDYCEGTTLYYKGIYNIYQGGIFMKSTMRVEVVFDYNTYKHTGDTLTTEIYGESYYSLDSCNSNLMLVSAPDPPASYGLLDHENLSLSKEIIRLLNSGEK